jgi:hypothetical protein
MTTSPSPRPAPPGARRAPFVPVPPPRAAALAVCHFVALAPPSLRPALGRSCGNHLIT